MDITKLPFNQLVGIERCEDSENLLRLPAGDRYTNHLGTVHASALMALAEATSGEFLLEMFPQLAGTSAPVVRRFEAKFRKPANGTIISTASVDADALAKFDETYQRRGKASLEVAVDVYDQQGAHVLSAAAGWFVAKLNPDK